MTRLTPERWQQMENLFEQALDWPPEERAQQLERTCGGDTELYRQVLELLRRHEQIEGFLETPVSRLLETAAAVPVGQAIGPYRVIDRLGEGGMGVVYLAERADGQFSKRVALKLLRPSGVTDFLVKRFRAERQLLAQLEHPNIARLLDGGTAADGSPYLVMEYVDGQAIDVYCKQRRLGVRERLELFLQVCAAVAYAHRQRVIHRDLKPGNILVSAEGTVKLLDFGIARLLEPEAEMTATANRMFTPAYAAPEQLQGAALSPATDVYALGAVLYELLTLRRPLPVPTQDGEAKRTVDPPSRAVSGSTTPSLEGLPEPPSQLGRQLRGELDALAMKALAPSPDQRYATVDALVHDIRNHLGGQPVEAFGRSWLYRARKFLGRHGTAAAALTATSLALVVSLGWFLYGRQGPSTARTVAVLPFIGMGTPLQENYLVDGLTIDLTTQLGKVADLTVLADKAAMRYKDSPKSLKEIAQELGATHVLTGSVRWSSDRIRVAARLVEPESGRQLWAEGYDRQLKDVFAIQSEVARSIAGALEAQLSPGEQAHLEQIPTANVTAYQYYLQGREYFRRRSRKDNDQAVKLYKEALALDPDFALAHVGLAAVYLAKATSGDGSAWVQAGCAEAHRAVALAPSLAESYNVLGTCHMRRGEQLAGQNAYRRSIELNPNYPAPMGNYGNLLIDRGKLDEALPWMHKALALNPTEPLLYERLYFVYMLLGEQAQAERYLQRGMSLVPDYERFGWIRGANLLGQRQYGKARQVIRQYLQDKPDNLAGLSLAGDIERFQGRRPQARLYYEKIRSLVADPDWYGPYFLRLTTVLAHVEFKENRPERVKALLASSLASNRQGLKTGREIWISWYDMAAVHAIRGEQDLALVALKQAIDSGFYFVKSLESEPIFAPLHNNTAFKRLLSDLKDRMEAMRLRARAQQT